MPGDALSLSLAALARVVGDANVLTRPIDLAVYACDASVYRIVPRAVVRPSTIEHVAALFDVARRYSVPLAFRAAGTSLSGQAVTPGILVDLSRNWRLLEVLDGGRRVRVEPGVVGAAVNARLLPWGAKLGPDPASLQACMMGGILANNSSGMCCGVAQNAYHTLDSLVFALPSGTVIDTADPDADDRLRALEPDLHAGLLALRAEVLANEALLGRIRRKYRMKNTTGYSLNAVVDFARPVEILRHLLVGSEGTLGFIAGAVLRTVPDLPERYTGLLLFEDIRAACAAIVPLKDQGAAALEVMDRAAIRSVESQPGTAVALRSLPEGAAGLLVEFQGRGEAERSALERAARSGVERLRLLSAPIFTHDASERAALWKVRQGMFPSVGAARRRGTAVLIEDVAFPVERLADAVVDLQTLFAGHGYPDAIIFGHAREGNLHFVLSQSFNTSEAISRYAAFMEDVVTLVTAKYDGALKAEHGTGRNMAPFVEAEWGREAYALMRRVKALADPGGLLNPGVLISEDPAEHLHHLKALPEVETEVDACMECGYCEPRCPSRDLTLTPRQRIVARREIARLADEGHAHAGRAIEVDFPYAALDTCAVDGLCGTACPVAIDTGQLTKKLRASRHGSLTRLIAGWTAGNMRAVEATLRGALRLAHVADKLGLGSLMTFVSRVPRAAGFNTPLWLQPMPRAAGPKAFSEPAGATAVYFPSCLSRTLGSLPGEPERPNLVEAMTRLAERAGERLLVPRDAAGHCCGVPFSSKGYGDAHRAAVNSTVEAMWRWSRQGEIPVVVDTSPCTYGLRASRPVLAAENQQRFDRLAILDAVEFAADRLLPRLEIRRKEPRVVLHPVCSLVKMNLVPVLERLAAACAEDVVIPLDAGCCGFAGDRGWLVPELTASATGPEAAEARRAGAAGHYSSSRTCEIGMTRATGRVYRSHLFLLEWATRTVES